MQIMHAFGNNTIFNLLTSADCRKMSGWKLASAPCIHYSRYVIDKHKCYGPLLTDPINFPSIANFQVNG